MFPVYPSPIDTPSDESYHFMGRLMADHTFRVDVHTPTIVAQGHRPIFRVGEQTGGRAEDACSCASEPWIDTAVIHPSPLIPITRRPGMFPPGRRYGITALRQLWDLDRDGTMSTDTGHTHSPLGRKYDFPDPVCRATHRSATQNETIAWSMLEGVTFDDSHGPYATGLTWHLRIHLPSMVFFCSTRPGRQGVDVTRTAGFRGMRTEYAFQIEYLIQGSLRQPVRYRMHFHPWEEEEEEEEEEKKKKKKMKKKKNIPYPSETTTPPSSSQTTGRPGLVTMSPYAGCGGNPLVQWDVVSPPMAVYTDERGTPTTSGSHARLVMTYSVGYSGLAHWDTMVGPRLMGIVSQTGAGLGVSWQQATHERSPVVLDGFVREDPTTFDTVVSPLARACRGLRVVRVRPDDRPMHRLSRGQVPMHGENGIPVPCRSMTGSDGLTRTCRYLVELETGHFLLRADGRTFSHTCPSAVDADGKHPNTAFADGVVHGPVHFEGVHDYSLAVRAFDCPEADPSSWARIVLDGEEAQALSAAWVNVSACRPRCSSITPDAVSVSMHVPAVFPRRNVPAADLSYHSLVYSPRAGLSLADPLNLSVSMGQLDPAAAAQKRMVQLACAWGHGVAIHRRNITASMCGSPSKTLHLDGGGDGVCMVMYPQLINHWDSPGAELRMDSLVITALFGSAGSSGEATRVTLQRGEVLVSAIDRVEHPLNMEAPSVRGVTVVVHTSTRANDRGRESGPPLPPVTARYPEVAGISWATVLNLLMVPSQGMHQGTRINGSLYERAEPFWGVGDGEGRGEGWNVRPTIGFGDGLNGLDGYCFSIVALDHCLRTVLKRLGHDRIGHPDAVRMTASMDTLPVTDSSSRRSQLVSGTANIHVGEPCISRELSLSIDNDTTASIALGQPGAIPQYIEIDSRTYYPSNRCPRVAGSWLDDMAVAMYVLTLCTAMVVCVACSCAVSNDQSIHRASHLVTA